MFYIYENWRAKDKTVIHVANCKFCNFGEGLTTGSGHNGKWHGPFDTIQEAEIKAQQLNRNEKLYCQKCNPDEL